MGRFVGKDQFFACANLVCVDIHGYAHVALVMALKTNRNLYYVLPIIKF